jgi:Ca2+-dependent lipid-binding protein
MQLIVTLSAEDLPTKGAMGGKLPDPFAIVTIASKDEDVKPTTVGQTEVIQNTTSPDWTTRLVIDHYDEGDEMNLVVTVLHQLSKDTNETLCSIPFEVSSVMRTDDSIMTKDMKGCDGKLSIRIEEKPPSAGKLHFQIRAVNLKNVDGLGLGIKKSDPFYEFHRYRHQTKRNIVVGDAVYRSSICENNLHPVWPAGTVEVAALVTDSSNDTFRLAVYDADDKRSRVLIGQVDVKLNDIIENVNETALSDIEKIDFSKSLTLLDNDGEKHTGTILVLSAEITDI